jgi:hypothetical protein
MSDAYVEVTRTSWGKRLGGSIKGILTGILLVIAGIVLLFWNEGRAVKRARALTAGADQVVTIDPARIEPGNDGRLVHATGVTSVAETLRDPLFGVAAQGLLLEREVEMFQWREQSTTREEKKLGGATETTTTYDYRTEWSAHPVDSSRFKVQEGHENPGRFPFGSEQLWAERVTLGGLLLESGFVRGLARKERLELGEEHLAAIPEEPLRASVRLEGGGLYRGADPASPRVGDLRVRFFLAPVTVASVVGEQRGAELVAHSMRGGQVIALVQRGEVPASAMFEAAQSANRWLAWLLRGGGFLLVLVGFGAVLRPLSVLADVVPMVGNLVGMGTGMVSFALAAATSMATIAIGWVVYRPVVGVALLLAAAGLGYWLLGKLRRRRGAGKRPAAAPLAVESLASPVASSEAPPAGSP